MFTAVTPDSTGQSQCLSNQQKKKEKQKNQTV